MDMGNRNGTERHFAGLAGPHKTARKDAIDAATRDTAIDTALKSDVDYIKRGVDDIKLDMRAQATKVEGIDLRVARVEESTKSAHHRLDRLEAHNN